MILIILIYPGIVCRIPMVDLLCGSKLDEGDVVRNVKGVCADDKKEEKPSKGERRNQPRVEESMHPGEWGEGG